MKAKRGKTKIKRGQVTFFVIIAIVIVLVIAVIFLFMLERSANINQVDPIISPIQYYTTQCLTNNAYDAVRITSVHGGYFEIGYATPGGTPYYYDYFNKTRYMNPSKEILEDQLNKYMNVFSQVCDFTKFSDFNITLGNITTKSKIENSKVTFNIKYPLTIVKGDRTYYLENFNVEVPIKLGIINTAINEFFNQSKEKDHESLICMSCLYNIATKYNLNFELYDYDNNTILYIVRDKKTVINNMTYQFNFAAKYPRPDHITNKTHITLG